MLRKPTSADFSLGEHRFTRRVLLRNSFVLSTGVAAASLLAACGGSKSAPPAPTTAATTSATTTAPTTAAPTTAAATGGSPVASSTSASPVAVATTQPTAAATAQSTAQAKDGGTLDAGYGSDFLTMDPALSTALIDRQLYYMMYTPLVQLSTTGDITPGLAEKWEIADPMTYTFNLRTGVKFHDGTDFNADIAKWNIDRMRDKSTGSQRVSELSSISDTTAVDANTLQIKLSASFSPLLATLTDRGSMMASQAAVQKFGKDYATNPVGTGPYQFVEWKTNDHLTIKKFAGYYDTGLPHLDQITFHPVTNEDVKETNLRTGSMGFIDTVPPKDLTTVEGDSKLQVQKIAGLNFYYFDLNNASAPFSNRSLRRAVAWATDRDAVHKLVYYSTGVISNGPIPPTSWAYDPTYKPFTVNLDQAKTEMTAGGQPDGFEFTLLTTDSPANRQLTQLVQAQLKAANINMKIQLTDSTSLSTALSNGNFQAVFAQWSGRVDPDGNMFYYFTKDGSFNYRKYMNDQVDTLLRQARTETDQSKRKDLYQQAQKLVVEDAPLLFLHHNQVTHGMTAKLQGYQMYPDGLPRFNSVWLDQ